MRRLLRLALAPQQRRRLSRLLQPGLVLLVHLQHELLEVGQLSRRLRAQPPAVLLQLARRRFEPLRELGGGARDLLLVLAQRLVELAKGLEGRRAGGDVGHCGLF